MDKICVVGDRDSIYGFAALGLSIFPTAGDHEEDAKLLRRIIQIPGVSGNTGAGIQGVKQSVEKAVGSDILFGNDD